MKHLILLHGLHMHSWSLTFLKNKLKLNSDFNVLTFGYHSTLFSTNVVDRLQRMIDTLPKNDEIYIIGHSMGGLIGRIFLEKKQPNKSIHLITLGTPHKSSLLGKTIQKSPFRLLMGSSGQSGIVSQLPPWSGKYPLYCIAGISKIGVASLVFHGHPESHDGTVFVKEAIEDNCTQSFVLENLAHSQMIFSNKVVELVNQIIRKENYATQTSS